MKSVAVERAPHWILFYTAARVTPYVPISSSVVRTLALMSTITPIPIFHVDSVTSIAVVEQHAVTESASIQRPHSYTVERVIDTVLRAKFALEGHVLERNSTIPTAAKWAMHVHRVRHAVMAHVCLWLRIGHTAADVEWFVHEMKLAAMELVSI